MLFKETPGYNEILDLYIAYGIFECLVRDGVENLRFFPRGNKYFIVLEEPNINIKNKIEKGMLNALEDMLSLHKAIDKYIFTKKDIKIVSDIDFSAGAIVEQETQKQTPIKLEKILNKLKNGESLSNKKEITVPLPLMPTAGKYMPKIYGVKSGNPIKIDEFHFALAWIGFHYYAPYINVSDNEATYIHIYAIKPIEELGLIEIFSLKDIKKKINNYQIGKDKFFINKKLALLYHLAHTESISALETITKKNFSVVSYTLERKKENKTQAIRSFGEYDLPKLMDFLWHLKASDFYNAIQFIDNMLISDLEIPLNFIDGILYDNLNAVYLAIRKLKKVPYSIIKAILHYFESTLDAKF